MSFKNIFRSFVQITRNTIDIAFIKEELQILKNKFQGSSSAVPPDIRNELNNITNQINNVNTRIDNIQIEGSVLTREDFNRICT